MQHQVKFSMYSIETNRDLACLTGIGLYGYDLKSTTGWIPIMMLRSLERNGVV